MKNRLNKGSEIVLRGLQQSQKLMSAQDICFWLKEQYPDDAPALTTVYRAIDILLRNKMIQAVDLGDGEKRYESVEPGEHHHHLICTNCRTSIHLDECSVETFSKRVEERHGFMVKSHMLEIFGICAECTAVANGNKRTRLI